MYTYRTTIEYDKMIPAGEYESYKETVDEKIREVGFIHGHKSEHTVEFEVQADDMWQLRGTVEELAEALACYGIDFKPERENAYGGNGSVTEHRGVTVTVNLVDDPNHPEYVRLEVDVDPPRQDGSRLYEAHLKAEAVAA